MSRGLLYLAKGDTFVSEATLSAKQASAVMPDYPITVVTDREPEADCFDNVIVDSTQFEKRNKPQALRETPYDQTIYLDTDTYLTDSLTELYDLLGEFDLGVRRDREQAHVPEKSSLPESFPEFNSGVIVYETTESVVNMLSDWEERCLPSHEFDQRSFRESLFYSDVRFSCIPNRFNCMYRYDDVVDGQVKIFHGPLVDRERNSIDLQEAIPRLNESGHVRLHYSWNGKLFVDPAPSLVTKVYQTARRDGVRKVLLGAIRKLRERVAVR